jgi:CHAD domain-containing protein
MQTLMMPKIDIFKSVESWTVEDRHQLRVFLRRLRTQMRLLRKEKKSRVAENLKLSELDKLSKKFLDTCGQVRDIDVLIETMHYCGLQNRPLKKILQANRTEGLNNLKQKWSIKKRRELIARSREFIDYLQKKKPIKKKLVLRTGNKLMEVLVHKDPESKIDWHEFRRKLRRANYLLDLAGERNINLVKFQKFLGIVHDLENLKKFSRDHDSLKHANIEKSKRRDMN